MAQAKEQEKFAHEAVWSYEWHFFAIFYVLFRVEVSFSVFQRIETLEFKKYWISSNGLMTPAGFIVAQDLRVGRDVWRVFHISFLDNLLWDFPELRNSKKI